MMMRGAMAGRAMGAAPRMRGMGMMMEEDAGMDMMMARPKMAMARKAKAMAPMKKAAVFDAADHFPDMDDGSDGSMGEALINPGKDM